MRFESCRITLRSVAISDVGTILIWENDPALAPFSDAHEPYTEEQIVDFVVEQQLGFGTCRQIRLMIDVEQRTIGAVDIFNYEGTSAEVGVLIYSIIDRRLGYATEALEVVKNIAHMWGITTLWASIDEQNIASIALFRGCGFVKVDKNRYKYEQNSISVNTFGGLR